MKPARDKREPPDLMGAVAALHRHYGAQQPPPTVDPFELVLWENVAYLAPEPRRREAFERLRRTVGTRPDAILRARPRALEAVTAHGILKATFAAKLRECARVARDERGGLGAIAGMALADATRALRRFPGIGLPGADKVLLFAGIEPLLAPDSNGLRVLTRLGLVREGASYAQTYAAARGAADELSRDTHAVQQAHLLLQRHGRTLCRHKAPRCSECPLAPSCAHARRAATARAAALRRAGDRRR